MIAFRPRHLMPVLATVLLSLSPMMPAEGGDEPLPPKESRRDRPAVDEGRPGRDEQAEPRRRPPERRPGAGGPMASIIRDMMSLRLEVTRLEDEARELEKPVESTGVAEKDAALARERDLRKELLEIRRDQLMERTRKEAPEFRKRLAEARQRLEAAPPGREAPQRLRERAEALDKLAEYAESDGATYAGLVERLNAIEPLREGAENREALKRRLEQIEREASQLQERFMRLRMEARMLRERLGLPPREGPMQGMPWESLMPPPAPGHHPPLPDLPPVDPDAVPFDGNRLPPNHPGRKP